MSTILRNLGHLCVALLSPFVLVSCDSSPTPFRTATQTTLEIAGVHYVYFAQKDTFEANARLRNTAKRLYKLELVPELRTSGPLQSESIRFPVGTKFRARALVVGTTHSHRGEKAAPLRPMSLMEWDSLSIVQGSQKVGALEMPLVFAYDSVERGYLEAPMRLFIELTPLDDPSLLPIYFQAIFNPLVDQFPSTATETLPGNFDDTLEELVPEESFVWKDLNLPNPVSDVMNFQGVKLKKPRLKGIEENPFVELRKQADQVILIDEGNSLRGTAFEHIAGWVERMLALDSILDRENKETQLRIHLFARALCPVVFPGDEAKKCKKLPEDFLKLEFFEVVDQSEPVALDYRGTDQPQLQAMGRFFMEEIETSRSYETFQISEGDESGLMRKAGFETMGTGLGAYEGFVQHRDHSISAGEDARTFDVRNRVEVREMQSFLVDRSYFNFELKTRRCLGVRALGSDFLTLVCRGKQDQRFIDYPWYFITDTQQLVGMGRGRRWEGGHRRWVHSIRGQQLYRKFKNAMESTTGELVLVRYPSFFEGTSGLLRDAIFGKNSLARWMADEGRYPGVLRFRDLRKDLYKKTKLEF